MYSTEDISLQLGHLWCTYYSDHSLTVLLLGEIERK